MDRLQQLSDGLEAAAKKDPGPAHGALLEDLYGLRDLILGTLHEAQDLEFHDYANTKYATPKFELNAALMRIRDRADVLAQNTRSGKYDDRDPLPGRSAVKTIADSL